MKLDIEELKKNYQMIHFFGLGFVQLKIDNNLRYHFYHPDLSSIVQNEEVHNHRYNFISTILAGSLTNIVFDFNFNPNGLYLLEKESCNINDKIESSPFDLISVDLSKRSEKTYIKGESYTFLTNEYHKVSTDFAITRLYRGQVTSSFANVIRKKEKSKVCPFSKKLTETECWNIVQECINKSN
jgi:hypothetical protein